jgi:glutaredoxin 3
MPSAAAVIVYTTGYCPYCYRAKSFLSQKGVEFEEIDVSGDRQKRAWLLQVTGQRTVPQIFINGRSVGGCDDIMELDARGKLDPLLALAPAAG